MFIYNFYLRYRRLATYDRLLSLCALSLVPGKAIRNTRQPANEHRFVCFIFPHTLLIRMTMYFLKNEVMSYSKKP